ncbi:hypothetical protein Lal_00026675 [Lupinus albus]|uniref:Uncharacterized protein n=1 Tax=Lupinus albus TaxID=3870 RepID=A0A6A5LLE2_LUPAL|nr:hypothetical protein Lalb_Chr09g0332251 [Lupinus albus]KAF1862156.1 hypothetical protein Lal_00026675 [Lupinus albus]
MTIALFSVPTPHQALFYKYSNTYPSSSKFIVPLCSSSSTSTSSTEPSPSPLPQQSQYATKLSGCKACGREEMEKGCNGEGRIQGGIATVPGFGWWPIKAYRPCPGFVAAGGRYRRQGQSMDEVAFGRGGAPSPSFGTAADSDPSSKKGKSEEI